MIGRELALRLVDLSFPPDAHAKEALLRHVTLPSTNGRLLLYRAAFGMLDIDWARYGFEQRFELPLLSRSSPTVPILRRVILCKTDRHMNSYREKHRPRPPVPN